MGHFGRCTRVSHVDFICKEQKKGVVFVYIFMSEKKFKNFKIGNYYFDFFFEIQV